MGWAFQRGKRNDCRYPFSRCYRTTSHHKYCNSIINRTSRNQLIRLQCGYTYTLLESCPPENRFVCKAHVYQNVYLPWRTIRFAMKRNFRFPVLLRPVFVQSVCVCVSSDAMGLSWITFRILPDSQDPRTWDMSHLLETPFPRRAVVEHGSIPDSLPLPWPRRRCI